MDTLQHSAGGRPVGRLGLDIDTWVDRGRVVVEVAGEVDCYSVPMLRETLMQLAGPRPLRIAVLMHGVGFLDSAGIGALIGAVKRAQATGGSVALIGCGPHVDRILRRMGLDKVFGLHDSLDSAFVWLDAR